MKRPQWVRGALFSSHAHFWEYRTGVAYVDSQSRLGQFYPSGLVYGAIVWYKRRRIK